MLPLPLQGRDLLQRLRVNILLHFFHLSLPAAAACHLAATAATTVRRMPARWQGAAVAMLWPLQLLLLLRHSLIGCPRILLLLMMTVVVIG